MVPKSSVTMSTDSEEPAFCKRLENLPVSFHGYKFVRKIGSGGYSHVFLVEHEERHVEYVAKVIQVKSGDGKSYLSSFNAEIESLMQLNHPNIIRLYDFFSQDYFFVLVLEYCSSGSLASEVKSVGMQYQRFVIVGRQIVSALNYCHDRKIAHHDIKLENILLDVNGKPKLADFGLSAKISDGGLCTIFKGSLAYAAPELFQKKAYDPFKADIWALAVLFVYMLTGSSPWPAEKDKMKEAMLHGFWHAKSRLPTKLHELVKRMFDMDPEKRPSIKQIQASPVFHVQESMPGGIGLNPYTANIPDFMSPRTREMVSLNKSRDMMALSCPNCQSLTSTDPTGELENEPNAIKIYRANHEIGNGIVRTICPRLHRKQLS